MKRFFALGLVVVLCAGASLLESVRAKLGGLGRLGGGA
jgi:hypothetical protein